MGNITLYQTIIWSKVLIFMQITEKLRWIIRDLLFHSFKIDWIKVQTGWCASSQPSNWKTQISDGLGHFIGRWLQLLFPVVSSHISSCFLRFHSDVNFSSQESACCQNHVVWFQNFSIFYNNTFTFSVLNVQIAHTALINLNFASFQSFEHGVLVYVSVHLCTRAINGWTFWFIQNFELDATLIRYPAH